MSVQISDGTTHCTVGSDEVNCEHLGVSLNFSKKCDDNPQCVTAQHYCHGRMCCPGGSDEAEMNGKNITKFTGTSRCLMMV